MNNMTKTIIIYYDNKHVYVQLKCCILNHWKMYFNVTSCKLSAM